MDTEEFQPQWSTAPGDTIAEILKHRHMSLAQFARNIDLPTELVKELLDGRTAITLGLARQLSHVLGSSVEFWMSRDFQYRQDAQRLHTGEGEWLRGLPVADMIRFGWLSPSPHPSEELSACLAFFNVASVPAWYDAYAHIEELVKFRTSPTFDSKPSAVAAWLRQAERESETLECWPWNPSQFLSALHDIRALTRTKDPKRFLPLLRGLCAQQGVAVVVVRAPSGCRASGATRFLSHKKALLVLSFRYLTDDQFWFTFFHEAAHLLLHGEEELFLEGADTKPTQFEEEANAFAADILIPPQERQAMFQLGANAFDIIRYAGRIGVSPGIVVGQLQHYGVIRHEQLNRLKRRFRWEE